MSEPNDPYRYGPPVPQQPSGYAPVASKATGRQILGSSWRLLKADPELVVLPFIGTIASLVAAAILFVPGWLLGASIDSGDHRGSLYIGGVLAAFAASIVGIFFQAALVIGANERADGGSPTFGGVMAKAWAMRGPILAWALLTTTVGVLVRALEQRLGIFGRLLGFLGGLAWAIVSFLAIPAIVAEGLGPVAAARRSGALIRQTWGTGLRTTLRFGLIQFALLIPALIVVLVGGALVGANSLVAGAIVLAVGIIALVALITVLSAISTYAQALIYRYAVGRPVPGVPAGMLGGAFAPRRRRGRR